MKGIAALGRANGQCAVVQLTLPMARSLRLQERLAKACSGEPCCIGPEPDTLGFVLTRVEMKASGKISEAEERHGPIDEEPNHVRIRIGET